MHINSKQANQTIKHNDQIKTKLSTQGPSGVAILSHVCGVMTNNVHSQNISGKIGRQEILVFY
jgi:hypothetical protein